MKRYPVAVLRERLAEALDVAYSGAPVLIERRGVLYRLTREAAPKKRNAKRPRLFEAVDPALMAGNWTWNWTPNGMAFAGAARSAKKTRR